MALSDAGYATYSNYNQYQVSGAEKLYTVSEAKTSSVVLAEKDASTVFYAGSAILIKGTTKVTINAVAEGTEDTALGTNYLVGSKNGTLDITAGDGKYIFNWDGSDTSTVGFYKANSGTLGAHKAYLDISGVNAREYLSFDFDGSTGINNVEATNADNIIYSLQGVRMSRLQKGINILNGKKVLVK